MSLSNSNTANWGTIFMGPERLHETTLSRLENSKSNPTWGDDTETEYFERVKSKATQKAMQILAQAQSDADAMLLQAQQQGYEQGLAQAQAELDEFRQAAGDTASAVLLAIEAQSQALTNAWENELVQLVKLAVEAGIGRELSENRAATLGAMFHNAVKELAAEQRALVCVNPEDEPVVADIIAAAGQNLSERFQTKGDPALPPGSIVLESAFGRLENTLEHRRKMVDKILEELVLNENSTTDTVKQNNLSGEHVNGPASVQATEQVAEQMAGQADMPIGPIEPVEQIEPVEPIEQIQTVQAYDQEAGQEYGQESEQMTEQMTGQTSEQATGLSVAEQHDEDFVEEEILSPLDSLTLEEGSLIPSEILNNETVQATVQAEVENAIETASGEVADSLTKTPEELLQAQKDLSSLNKLDDLEEETSNSNTKQADADEYIDALLAEENK